MSDTSLTIRISRSTHELLRDLAAKSNATITAVVDEAVRDLSARSSGRTSTPRVRPFRPTPWRGLTSGERTQRGKQTLADGLEEEQQSDEQPKAAG